MSAPLSDELNDEDLESMTQSFASELCTDPESRHRFLCYSQFIDDPVLAAVSWFVLDGDGH